MRSQSVPMLSNAFIHVSMPIFWVSTNVKNIYISWSEIKTDKIKTEDPLNSGKDAQLGECPNDEVYKIELQLSAMEYYKNITYTHTYGIKNKTISLFDFRSSGTIIFRL